MASPIGQRLVNLRSEIATSINELNQKTDATSVALAQRTEVLAALGKQMSEVSGGVKVVVSRLA